MSLEPPRLRPTVIIPDTAPLIHLAGAGALTVLNGMGRVLVPDIVVLEATFDDTKPFARDIAAWVVAGQQPGTNQPVEVAASEFGPLYRLAAVQGLARPRNAGEIAIAAWLAENLLAVGGPALVIYENGRVPNMLLREGVTATVAVATTRNLLDMAQRNGTIPDAAALWSRIVAASPTANPASAITYIEPDTR